MLRREGSADKVLPVTNKVDDDSWQAHAHDAAALGFGEPIPVSAKNNCGRRQLAERCGTISDSDVRPRDPPRSSRSSARATPAIHPHQRPRRATSVSSSPRSPAPPGIRDVRFEIEESTFSRSTPPGSGRRSRGPTTSSTTRTPGPPTRSAQRRVHPPGRRDQGDLPGRRSCRSAAEAVQADGDRGQQVRSRRARDPAPAVRRLSHPGTRGLSYAPLTFISAKEGQGLEDVVKLVSNLDRQSSHRETTGQVNKLIQEILAEQGPSSSSAPRPRSSTRPRWASIRPPW